MDCSELKMTDEMSFLLEKSFCGKTTSPLYIIIYHQVKSHKWNKNDVENYIKRSFPKMYSNLGGDFLDGLVFFSNLGVNGYKIHPHLIGNVNFDEYSNVIIEELDFLDRLSLVMDHFIASYKFFTKLLFSMEIRLNVESFFFLKALCYYLKGIDNENKIINITKFMTKNIKITRLVILLHELISLKRIKMDQNILTRVYTATDINIFIHLDIETVYICKICGSESKFPVKFKWYHAIHKNFRWNQTITMKSEKYWC